MSHSCTPNCQAIVMACGGRLTIALYTVRHIYEGLIVEFAFCTLPTPSLLDPRWVTALRCRRGAHIRLQQCD